MLEPLDVAPEEEELYRAMLTRHDVTMAELVDATGRDRSRLRRALGALEARGLVSRTPTRPIRFRPAPPDEAVEALALHRHEEIERARLAAAELSVLFHAADRSAAGSPVQVIQGREATAARIVAIQQATRQELLILDGTEPADRQVRLQQEQLRRGVRYRTVYDREALAAPDQAARVRDLAAAGEQARVMDAVPLTLVISDRAIGLIPLPRPADRQTVVLQASALLDGVIALFELLWERATPLWPQGRAAGARLSEEDEQLLGYAAAGYTDRAIARRLGVAQRTVERRMRRVMDRLDARTRFQAGLQAAERGILGRGRSS